jgi:hypothetical protein
MSWKLYKDIITHYDGGLDIGKTDKRWKDIWAWYIIGFTITDEYAYLTQGNWTGIKKLSMSDQLTNTLADGGVSPFVITSKTMNINLNADLLDGLHADDIVGGIVGEYLKLDCTNGPLTGLLGIGSDITVPTHILEIEGSLNQVAVPKAIACVAATGDSGLITAVNLKYIITFVNAAGETGGQESLQNKSNTVSPTDQKVELTDIPLGPTGVTKRKIYRSDTNTGGLYMYYLDTINDNTTTTYSDNLSYADWATGVGNGTRYYIPWENTTAGGLYTSGTRVAWFGDPASWYPGLFIGLNAGHFPSSGQQNTYIGRNAGTASAGSSSRNVFIGDSAGSVANAGTSDAVFIGNEAGITATAGVESVFLGSYSGKNCTGGSYNTLIGAYTGYDLGAGYYNIFLGSSAGKNAINTNYRLLIDGIGGRSSWIDEQTKSIIYGIMAPMPTNQDLTFNADVGIAKLLPVHRLDVGGHIRMSTLANAVQFTAALGAAGNITQPNMRYLITYVTSEGETCLSWSPQNYSVEVSPVAQKVELSNIPLGSALVTQRKLYRNVSGSYQFAWRADIGLTVTTYTDDLAEADWLATNPPSIHQENTTAGVVYVDTTPVLSFGSSSTLVGIGAGNILHLGMQNTFIGAGAGINFSSTDTGSRNIFIGDSAGSQNVGRCADNILIGSYAGQYLSLYGPNVLIGSQAGQNITTGANNLALGYLSGRALGTGSNNIFIGDYSGAYSVNTNSELFIDSYNRTTYANEKIQSIIYGKMATSVINQKLYLNVNNLGIGQVPSPVHRVDIGGHLRFTSVADVDVTLIVATAGAAGAMSGGYNYTCTFVNDEGETNGLPLPYASASNKVYPVNQVVDLTNIPLGPPGVTARKLYRSADTDWLHKYYLATISDNTTTTYQDNALDVALGAQPDQDNKTAGRIYVNDNMMLSVLSTESKIGIGAGGGPTVQSPYSTYIGAKAGENALSSAWANTCVGMMAARNVSSGSYNVTMGWYAGYSLGAGSYNVVIGGNETGYGMGAGNYNIIIGSHAGHSLNGGSRNIIIGSTAGFWATGTGELYIDGYGNYAPPRADNAEEKIKSIIYGQMATQPANQTLAFNARVSTPYQFTNSLAIGTSPFAVTSTTVNTNLNADLLDGYHASEIAPKYKQTEIDFGVTPVNEASFTITDADVTTSSKIVGGVAYEAPTGKDLDELEFDTLELRFVAGTGQFVLYVQSKEGYVADKFKVNYSYNLT